MQMIIDAFFRFSSLVLARVQRLPAHNLQNNFLCGTCTNHPRVPRPPPIRVMSLARGRLKAHLVCMNGPVKGLLDRYLQTPCASHA